MINERITALREREEAVRNRPHTPEDIEMFQQACERGWRMPADPPCNSEMVELARAFLAKQELSQ
jgi:hypothetical protein